jgi:GNAT superfamily N-acetyltransferase
VTELPADHIVGPAAADDVDELTALCRARADEAGSSTFTSREGFEEMLWVVAEKKFPCEIVLVRRDGVLVGAAEAFRLETPVTADAWVHPSARNQELTTWLVEWTEDRARDMAERTEPSVPLWHRTHFYDVDVRSVLGERGYNQIRSFFRMEGQLGTQGPPPSVRGIEIRTLGRGDTEARASTR